jgi:3-hydroxyisobutyrate dehydrogenase
MKIGWIGTGVMGAPMAGHLQAAGHDLYVYTRTRGKETMSTPVPEARKNYW